MYYLVVWDKNLAATGQDGVVSNFEIPMDLAELFFHLDSAKFPNLSSLSFDDYDLFSGSQIESLAQELLHVAGANPLFLTPINTMMEMVYKAQSLDKSILFDPFRKE